MMTLDMLLLALRVTLSDPMVRHDLLFALIYLLAVVLTRRHHRLMWVAYAALALVNTVSAVARVLTQ